MRFIYINPILWCELYCKRSLRFETELLFLALFCNEGSSTGRMSAIRNLDNFVVGSGFSTALGVDPPRHTEL